MLSLFYYHYYYTIITINCIRLHDNTVVFVLAPND